MTAPTYETYVRIKAVAKLRTEGWTWRRIAEKYGYKNENSARATLCEHPEVWRKEYEQARSIWLDEIEAKAGKARTEEDRERPRQMIREAMFQDDVVLTQAKSGNLVRCPRLKVTMRLDRSKRPMPALAVATGKAGQRVYAVQDGSDIRADKVTVTFAERTRKTADGPRDRVEADQVTAEGNVRGNTADGHKFKTEAAEFRHAARTIESTAPVDILDRGALSGDHRDVGIA